ncbi:Pyoverdine/dityrosine biosynthesis protein-domain-containing protein [Infundibulicybe gibba]|nr:Pyoverdine/dityrosine biosynthesis protein-domain-containing protein [Infundibulicybe gibba]
MASPALFSTQRCNALTTPVTHLSSSFAPDLQSCSIHKSTIPQDSKLSADGKPVGVAPAAILQNGHRPQWINIGCSVDRILDIVTRFLYFGAEDQFEVTGRSYLRRVISRFVDRQEKIELVFPAFPFKSPSEKKVLGSLPDLGEELVLRRLDMLAQAIEDYHPPGAVIRIVSDGIVYGEILGRSDSLVYQYNAGLRSLISNLSLEHITFVRVADLLDSSSILLDDRMTESEYVNSIPSVRKQFLGHVVPGYDLDTAIKNDYGTLMTYRGYLKFLVSDLDGTNMLKGPSGEHLSRKSQERVRRTVARMMLENGARFSDLVAKRFPDAVRLSCHAHNNSGPKFAFAMFPGSGSGSPWHNTVIERGDGSLSLGHLSSFDPSTYEIVHRYGRPYYLREHSSARDLGVKINPHITFARHFPFGLVIEAEPSANISFNDLPMDNIRTLANQYSFVLLRGFSSVDRDDFTQKSEEFGEIVTWPKFGAILELKENPDLDMNSSLTCESMPMHYDGVFKTKTDENGELTHDPPNFQIFQCLHAPENDEGGKTLLSNTADLLQHGISPAVREWLSKMTYSVYTPQNKVFGGDILKLPLVMRNEATGHDVLRWHEHWPQHVTKYKPAESLINGVSEEDSVRIGDRLTDLLYDRRFCYAHSWCTGDYLIADNIEMMHTRTAFKPCRRELWRIHAD